MEPGGPRRSIALAAGHVVLAPVVALWIAILVLFFLVLSSAPDRGGWHPQDGNPAGGAWIVLMSLTTPWGLALVGLPLAASLAAGYGFGTGTSWARGLGRLLALATIGAIVNGVFWTVVYAPSSGSYTSRLFPPFLVVTAALGLAWSALVLWRTRVPAAVAAAPHRRVRFLRTLGLATGVLAVIALFAVVAAARTRVYVAREVMGGRQVLWGPDQAFICVHRATLAAPASVLNTLVQYDPLIPWPHHSRNDLLVAEIRPGGQSSRLLVGHSNGQCYVHHGVLHFQPVDSRGFSWGSGTPRAEIVRFQIERDQVWERGAFRDLAEHEKAARVEEILRVQDFHGIAIADGWQETSRPEGPVSFNLGGAPVEVRFDREGIVAPGRFQKVMVKVGDAREQTLLLVRHGEHLTSDSAYEAVVAASAARPAGR